MAAGRIKGITIEIGGDTTKLTKALASVDNAISNTQKNLRDIDKALKLDPTNINLIKDKQEEYTKAIANTEDKIKKEKEAYEELQKKLNEPMSLDQVEEFARWEKEAENLKLQIDLDTASLKGLKDEAKNTASVMGTVFQEAGKKISEVGDKIKGVGDKISDVGTTLTQKVTVPIAAAFGGSIKEAIDWESAFTGVMKTVDETATTTYDDLKDSINEIAKTTASSQNEIAAVMEIGGQLGVTADDIAEFTKNVIMLGDTTNLSSEEAATAIARYANVTGMSIAETSRLGSVIVDLGNNYATTEADIMEMAQRLSGAGAQIGLTEGEILGFSTALSSVGIAAEMGGSAFSKAMIKMQVAAESGTGSYEEFRKKLAEIQPEYAALSDRDVQIWLLNDSKAMKDIATSTGYTKKELTDLINTRANLANFGEVAGMTGEQFAELFKNDAPAAIQAFIQGLGNTEEAGESTIQMLQDMGFTEVRLRDTLTRLASSGDLVTNAINQGNQAWMENTAMQEEAEKRYATMETQISQLKARITEIAVEIGEMLMPYVHQLMDFIQGIIDKWNGLDEDTKAHILQIAAIVAAVGPVVLIVGKIITGIGALITAIGTITSAIGAVMGALAALTAPMIAIPLAIAAIIAAIVLCVKHWDEIKEAAGKAAEFIAQKWEEFKNKIKEIWDQTVKNVKTAVDNMKNNVKNVFDAIKNDAISKVTSLKTSALNLFNTLKSGITEKASSIKESIVGAFRNAVDYISSLPSQALGWGRDIINGLVDGIRDAISSVTQVMSDVANTIAEFIHFSEPDKGPLSNFHTFMPDMIKEMVQGINKGIPMLENAMNGMAGSLVPSMNSVGNGGTTTVNLTVYGAQGQDVRELAEIIQQRINSQIYNQRAVFA